MKIRRLRLLQAVGAIFFVLLASASEVKAVERWLVPNTSQCAPDTTVNPCHTTLADAVNSALAGDTIKILPGTYPANVTLNKNITAIYGEETARTFLTGNGGTAIAVSGVTTPMDIRNISFINASSGILVTNASTQVSIKNNVFEVGSTTTAIQVTDTSSPSIMNNTFYQNGTAILSAPNTLSIINNIFSGNTLAISANVVIDNILNNLFWQNTTIGPTISFNSGDVGYKGNVNNQDPQFADPLAQNDFAIRDFHLSSKPTATGNTSAGANSINTISPPDVGAYGGSSSDTIPFPVSSLTGTATSGTSIDLTWSLNKCYMVTGYNIYSRIDKSGPPYDNETTPVDAGTPTSFPFTLTVVPPTPPSLTAPANLTSSPRSGALEISWDQVPNATGYEVSYKISTDPTFTVLPLMNTLQVTLTGLANPIGGIPTMYDISVRPYYQTFFYLAVKDYYAPNIPPNPNLKEALAFSKEAAVSVGSPVFGPSSAIQDFPEPLTIYPDLPNRGGCFIATAAYGYYSAPQVQALRELRDRYLITNSLGRSFVAWYYQYGPIGAEFITAHPWLKPVVRAALLPAVGGAVFMTQTSMLMKTIVLAVMSFVVLFFLMGRKREAAGE